MHFNFITFTKEELALMLTHYIKIFNYKSMCLVDVEKEPWTYLIISNYQNSTFEIVTITLMEIVSMQVFFFIVGSKWKNKNENTKYHGRFISFKSHLYLKPESSIFLFFGSWNAKYHGTFIPFKSQLYWKSTSSIFLLFGQQV